MGGRGGAVVAFMERILKVPEELSYSLVSHMIKYITWRKFVAYSLI
ncbi:hypothetical protein TRIP_C60406 [Candidatus Zixiibacteriota bacterium]|nr:hypothetical protein TRIP_C60406 [candidate division Zixibacteria bacterium]